LFIWLFIIALSKMALIALTAKTVIRKAKKAPVSALLQQVNGESPLVQQMMANAKNDITAILTAIGRAFNSIIGFSFSLYFVYM